MYISKKISKGIGIILKSRKIFNMKTMLSLYHIFVYPYLSYCMAYNTHINYLVIIQEKAMPILQNKAMLIISGVPPRTYMDKCYIDDNILIVKHIYSYNIGLFMYKYVNNTTADEFNKVVLAILLLCISIIQYMPLNITFLGTTEGENLHTLWSCVWNFILVNIDTNCAIGSFKRDFHQLFLATGDYIM